MEATSCNSGSAHDAATREPGSRGQYFLTGIGKCAASAKHIDSVVQRMCVGTARRRHTSNELDWFLRRSRVSPFKKEPTSTVGPQYDRPSVLRTRQTRRRSPWGQRAKNLVPCYTRHLFFGVERNVVSHLRLLRHLQIFSAGDWWRVDFARLPGFGA